MDERQETVIPVIQEKLRAGARKVRSGGVRVSKTAHEHQEVIDQPLMSEEVEVRRVIRNEPVTRAPEIRQEGDTTIIPVVKEVLKVEKHLVLAEEWHITKRRTSEPSRQTVTLRDEEATVERIDAEGKSIGTAKAVEERSTGESDRARIRRLLRNSGPKQSG